MNNDRDIWISIRQALLMIVDAIERTFNIEPRTSQLRRTAKDENKHKLN